MEYLITVHHPYSHEDIVLQSKEACKTDFHLTDFGCNFLTGDREGTKALKTASSKFY